MSRSRLLLLLFFLLLVALWYAWQNTPQQLKVSSRNVAIKGKSGDVPGGDGGFSIASLDFSGGEKLTYKKPKRDLFRPLYRAPAVKKSVALPKPTPTVVVPPPPPPLVKNLRPVGRPVTGPKPIPPLNVLGFLQKGPITTVFLSSRQGDLYLVKKGDRFADGLLVRELDGANIVISRGLNDQGVTLKVSESKALRMAIPNVSSGRPSVPVYTEPEPEPQADEPVKEDDK